MADRSRSGEVLGTLKEIERCWEVNLCPCKKVKELRNINREDLAELFFELRFERGAEIGVERGEYSKLLARNVCLKELLLVDAWTAYQGYREHVSQDKLDGFMQQVIDQFADNPAVKVIKNWSVAAAGDVPDKSLDFVYLDANHTYEHVTADIAAWAPKVRPSGIVSGHDYTRRKRMNYGVKEAVQEYAKKYKKDLIIIKGDRSPSWLWIA